MNFFSRLIISLLTQIGDDCIKKMYQDHGNRFNDGPNNQGNHHGNQGGGPSRGNNARHNPWGNDRSMGGNNNMGGGGNNRGDDHFAKRRRY